MTSQQLFSADEAAAYLGMDAESLRRLARQRKLRSYKIGRVLRFDLDELREDCRVSQPMKLPTKPKPLSQVEVLPDFDVLLKDAQ